jgi:hypothetical protein
MQTTITTEISSRRIADLFVTAIESGDPVTTASRGGWCDGIYYRTKQTKPPKGLWYDNPAFFDAPDFQVEIVEVDDETTGHTTGHIITRTNLLNGLKVLADKFPQVFADVVDDNVDAATADIFLQCVCFGEEKYA